MNLEKENSQFLEGYQPSMSSNLLKETHHHHGHPRTQWDNEHRQAGQSTPTTQELPCPALRLKCLLQNYLSAKKRVAPRGRSKSQSLYKDTWQDGVLAHTRCEGSAST